MGQNISELSSYHIFCRSLWTECRIYVAKLMLDNNLSISIPFAPGHVQCKSSAGRWAILNCIYTCNLKPISSIYLFSQVLCFWCAYMIILGSFGTLLNQHNNPLTRPNNTLSDPYCSVFVFTIFYRNFWKK